MKRALGIDLGEARIGLAISDELGMLAHPLETVTVKEIPDPVAHIAAIVARDKIGMIVLGLPRNMDGSYGPAAEKTRVFAEKLRVACACELKLWDERLTTAQAQRALLEAGYRRDRRKERVDQTAAALLLQSYLDSRDSGGSLEQP